MKKQPVLIFGVLAAIFIPAEAPAGGMFSTLFSKPDQEDLKKWIHAPWRFYAAGAAGSDSVFFGAGQSSRGPATAIGNRFVDPEKSELFGDARNPIPVLALGYGSASNAIEVSYRHVALENKSTRSRELFKSGSSWVSGNSYVNLNTSGKTDFIAAKCKVIYPQFLSEMMGAAIAPIWLNFIKYNAWFGLGASYAATSLRYSGDIAVRESYSSFGALLSFGLDIGLTDNMTIYLDWTSNVFARDYLNETALGLRYYF
jgi:hypothetical protein